MSSLCHSKDNDSFFPKEHGYFKEICNNLLILSQYNIKKKIRASFLMLSVITARKKKKDTEVEDLSTVGFQVLVPDNEN